VGWGKNRAAIPALILACTGMRRNEWNG